MKSILNNLPTRTWLVLVLTAVVAAYPIVRLLVPAVVHAVIPAAVRTLFSVI